MEEDTLTMKIGAPVGVPPSGKKTLFIDSDGTVKTIDSAAAKAPAGGGFGSDTIVQLPNSNNALVSALEMITTLTTNTAGAEVSKLLIELLSAGAQLGAWALEPAKITTDAGALTRTPRSRRHAGVRC